MNKQILVTYKSVTGFTRRYAKWIAEELDCAIMELKDVSARTMSEYNTVIFGGRFHAGLVDGLKKRKKKKSEYETAMAQALGNSYDLSSKEYIKPLVSYVIKGE